MISRNEYIEKIKKSMWDEQCESWEEDLEDVEVEYDLDVESKYY